MDSATSLHPSIGPGAAARRGLLVMAALLWAASAVAVEREAVATTRYFSFHSDFRTNLNDALLAAGVARHFGRAEAFTLGEPATCLQAHAPSVRQAWHEAVDWYAQVVAPTGWSDRPQYLLRMHLAGFEDQVPDDRARQFLGIADGFMAAAAPAYLDCRWPARDEANRRWIEALVHQLDEYGEDIAARLEELYRLPFTGLPIPVDVVETVSWSGANSLFWDPDGGHLLISSSAYRGREALEIVFHEASHQAMRPGRPVPTALYEAARESGADLPDDLWHVVLFYTTGDAVRGVLTGDVGPGYTPLLYGIFARGVWTEFREPVESAWPAYMDGESTLEQAARQLLAEVEEGQGAEP